MPTSPEIMTYSLSLDGSPFLKTNFPASTSSHPNLAQRDKIVECLILRRFCMK